MTQDKDREEPRGAKILSFSDKHREKKQEPEEEPALVSPHTVPVYIDFLADPAAESNSGVTHEDARRLRTIFLEGPIAQLAREVTAEVIHTVRLEMTGAGEGAPSILAKHECQLWQAYKRNGKRPIIPYFDALAIYETFQEEIKVARLFGSPRENTPTGIVAVPKKNMIVERFFWIILRMCRYQWEINEGIAEHTPERVFVPPPETGDSGKTQRDGDSAATNRAILPVESLADYLAQRVNTGELAPDEMLDIRLALRDLEGRFGQISGKAVYAVQAELARPTMTRLEVRAMEIAVWDQNPEAIPGFDVRRIYARAFADQDLPWVEATALPVKLLVNACDIRHEEAEAYFWLVLRMYRHHYKLSQPKAEDVQSAPLPAAAPTDPETFRLTPPGTSNGMPTRATIAAKPSLKITIREASWWERLKAFFQVVW